jgi:hypothetical protein
VHHLLRQSDYVFGLGVLQTRDVIGEKKSIGRALLGSLLLLLRLLLLLLLLLLKHGLLLLLLLLLALLHSSLLIGAIHAHGHLRLAWSNWRGLHVWVHLRGKPAVELVLHGGPTLGHHPALNGNGGLSLARVFDVEELLVAIPLVIALSK